MLTQFDFVDIYNHVDTLVAELPDGAAKGEHVKIFVGANDGTW